MHLKPSICAYKIPRSNPNFEMLKTIYRNIIALLSSWYRRRPLWVRVSSSVQIWRYFQFENIDKSWKWTNFLFIATTPTSKYRIEINGMKHFSILPPSLLHIIIFVTKDVNDPNQIYLPKKVQIQHNQPFLFITLFISNIVSIVYIF